MRKYVTTPLPQPISATAATAINTVIDQLKPFMTPLTDEELRGLRTMAEGREGLVRLVASIATQHEDSLPRQDNPADLTDALTADTYLETLRQAAVELLEMVTDMQSANSADIMILSDAYTQSLQANRKRKASLDAAMDEVDEWNRRYARRPNNENPDPIEP